MASHSSGSDRHACCRCCAKTRCALRGKAIKAKNVSHGGATERVTWEMLDDVNPELAAMMSEPTQLPRCSSICRERRAEEERGLRPSALLPLGVVVPRSHSLATRLSGYVVARSASRGAVGWLA